MFKKKNRILILLCCFGFCSNLSAQSTAINILNLGVKPVMPGDVNTWPSVPGAVFMTAQATTQMHSWPAQLVVQIKQGGSKVCGNTPQTGIDFDSFTVRNFNAGELVAPLSQCPKLKPGTYTICTQFFNKYHEPISREVCKEFTVADEVVFCNPIQNINPADEKIFSAKEFITPKIFTWTPFITTSGTIVTYRITVWEIEEGQSAAQAMYDNLPVLQEEVRGQTRYISRPGLWERGKKYVWRVEALNADGNLICKTALSAPTVFSSVDQEPLPPQKVTQDSTKKNTPCGNGDFESGILDPAEWSGGYTNLAGDNSTFSPPFNNIVMPASANPIDAPLGAGCGMPQSSQNHQVIVSVGADPTVPALKRVPTVPSVNKYALRLGNNCNGCGAERIQKKFTVTAANTNYKFMYALVFEVPHDSTHNPSLWVRVFDASGTAVPNLVFLDPLSALPMDRAVSDLANPYWQSYGGVLYRDWACAKIDLSSLVGQTVTVELMINDCAYCGHYGYGYFDNFCLGCDAGTPKDSCCSETIKPLTNSVNLLSGNVLNIVQNYNITPVNITKITAEIAFVNESVSDTSCRKCATNENAVWKFIPINKAIWNSGVGINASPVNSSGFYPAQNISWFCNAQGSLKLDMKIALPGIPASATCKRKGKICIRYTFTDTDCKVCEQYNCYDYSIN